MLTLQNLQQDSEIQAILKASDNQLDIMGFTEHGERHRLIVCDRVVKILRSSQADEHTITLGVIAGYLHDIGCVINRHNHAHYGGIVAFDLLRARGVSVMDACIVVNAIANHDEQTGYATNAVSAALILADKSDVHRNRVRKNKIDGHRNLISTDDIHDRVNYSVVDSKLRIDEINRKLMFQFTLDPEVASVSDYFEIFLGRMRMCQVSARELGFEFELIINGQELT